MCLAKDPLAKAGSRQMSTHPACGALLDRTDRIGMRYAELERARYQNVEIKRGAHHTGMHRE